MRGFGVVEYESAEQAEAVLLEMDRTMLGGREIRLSLCTPGASGRSTLAALIAAQGGVSPTWGQFVSHVNTGVRCDERQLDGPPLTGSRSVTLWSGADV